MFSDGGYGSCINSTCKVFVTTVHTIIAISLQLKIVNLLQPGVGGGGGGGLQDNQQMFSIRGCTPDRGIYILDFSSRT